MSTIAVVYRSKYGSSETYARWISEETGADLLNARKTQASALSAYDTVVYCGGLYAGGLLGFSLIKKSYSILSDKKVIVVAVGATTQKEKAVDEVREKNLTSDMRGKVSFFLLRGGLNYPKMNWVDRILMWLLVRSIRGKNQEELDNDSKGILATYGKVVDFTDRESIAPIVERIKEPRHATGESS